FKPVSFLPCYSIPPFSLFEGVHLVLLVGYRALFSQMKNPGFIKQSILTHWCKHVLCFSFQVDYTHRDQDPLNGPPEEFLLFLYHPFRKSFCFCTNSAKSQHTWKSVLRDGIRYCSTVLQRQDSFEVEAFLEAVRFYRQEKGSYGAGDLLLGTEPEILSNVLMEDLLPVLQSQVPPNLKGSESRKKQTWCQFLEEVYTLVLSQVSSEFLDFQRENEKLHIQLEKKIRPDLDQMLILKDQISIKLQAVIQNPVESCCRQGVEPDLDCVMEELIHPISLGFDVVRSLFADRIDEMIRHLTTGLMQVLTLGEMPWKPGFMEPCYEKANLYKDSLQGLKEKFGFHGVASLVLRAQNLMQQLMQNSVHTFQQLSEQHLSLATNHSQITQTLEKIKTRVLKKFDYDSSSTRKQFAQEWLVQIFLPFLLKNLEPRCKLNLRPEGIIRSFSLTFCYSFPEWQAWTVTPKRGEDFSNITGSSVPPKCRPLSPGSQ
uniref:Niban apoptosis regulator 3 n=1 Tax=Terrapene triunguis TaxID=2587831 RepID=A0A674ICV8_9SAUR